MSAVLPGDHAVRAAALDVARSFIVRAPAGSGKTRLLIQRYLALLATADAPEEVIAITFTRKAAAEMRERVLRALAAAGSAAPDVDDLTLALARAVLGRAAARQWMLDLDTSRLRILTLDSLNATLARQMPLATRFGAQPEGVEDAEPLYHEAARATLALVDEDHPAAAHVATLLAHLDNDVAGVEALLARMLATREKWLRHLHGFDNRTALEGALRRARALAIAEVARRYPQAEQDETLELMRFASQNRPDGPAGAGVLPEETLATWPGGDAEALEGWRTIAQLLLTKTEGAFRRKVDKKDGFPAGETKAERERFVPWKQRMLALLGRLGEQPGLEAALRGLRELPESGYTADEWRVLGAITALLPVATALLWNVFAARGQCDFAEIAQGAVRALGADDEPTDLALALDHRIRHLLVDEFQDTSFAQYDLLEKLVRGWSDGDGRTFFAVGDPMQSIYRFRNAEVGLYLRASRFGVGGIALAPLELAVNFRSSTPVVDWLNRAFAQLMPDAADTDLNRVPFAPSAASPGASQDGGVRIHAQVSRAAAQAHAGAGAAPDADAEEAARVVRLAQEALSADADGKVAILVRSRSHLAHIVPALKAAGLSYQAVDIDPLAGRAVVRDLLALTRAMLHPADRVAWLALLRAPWCALTAADLAALVGGSAPVEGVLQPDARDIWACMNDAARTAALSPAGGARVAWLCERLAPARALVRRLPLRSWLEPLWLSLLGPACLDAESSLADAARALDAIEAEARAQTGGAGIEDFAALDRAIGRLHATSLPGARIEIMTLHKAKGLEWDTVILPGLHRGTQGDALPLVVWHEQPDPLTGAPQLLLAPIRETGADATADTNYRYVQAQERARQREEAVRLMYVAATRAKRVLHLLGSARVKLERGEETLAEPAAASLLSTLWPVVAPAFQDALTHSPPAAPAAPAVLPALQAAPLRRLPEGACAPVPAPSVAGRSDAAQVPAAASVDFDWAGRIARHAGTVVHAWLHRIALEGAQHWNAERVAGESQRLARALLELGVEDNALADAGTRVADALIRTLDSARGRWILAAREGAESEWRLSGVRDGSIVHVAIDRSFIDEAGTRWIIDFKTGSHQGGEREAFLDNERERYRAQLEGYAALVSELDRIDRGGEPPPIRLGLYYPLLEGWREWDWRP
ncbi:MAG: UvrD-helicase domain-containing protein [Betaproteobacteria bacterium]|nr:UvrD-helicase domain-containing protein [Betaproteobacteria bacterium]